MADNVTITRDRLEALAAKLDMLDVDDDERAVLHALFAAAGEGEVSGYGATIEERPIPLSQGFLHAFHPGGKLDQIGFVVIGG